VGRIKSAGGKEKRRTALTGSCYRRTGYNRTGVIFALSLHESPHYDWRFIAARARASTRADRGGPDGRCFSYDNRTSPDLQQHPRRQQEPELESSLIARPVSRAEPRLFGCVRVCAPPLASIRRFLASASRGVRKFRGSISFPRVSIYEEIISIFSLSLSLINCFCLDRN